MTLQFGNAICYSGYRHGQSPRDKIYPSYEEVKEDLTILSGQWKYLRLYDCGPHAQLVIDVIVHEGFDFKLMLGADIGAEVNNPDCPWGATYSEQQLATNRAANDSQISKLIGFANCYPDIVSCVSIGNEASVDWTDHLVPVERLIEFARKVKRFITQPVTFCENYVPWQNKLKPLAEILDFISIHTYPIWEYQPLENALGYTEQNYRSVKELYPNKQVVITEAGWATRSNGHGIERDNASVELQNQYCQQLMDWSQANQVLTFLFEAFDEPWKGSEHQDEPEKHWGLFYVDRTPKPIMA